MGDLSLVFLNSNICFQTIIDSTITVITWNHWKLRALVYHVGLALKQPIGDQTKIVLGINIGSNSISVPKFYCDVSPHVKIYASHKLGQPKSLDLKVISQGLLTNFIRVFIMRKKPKMGWNIKVAISQKIQY